MKLGITLTGGGVRCVAHLAIIQALEREGIVPQVYSGTSGGALVGALLSSGLRPADVIAVLGKTSIFHSLKPALSFSGLLDMKKALSFALNFLPETFEELNNPLTIGTTNMQTGKSEFFSSGALIPPLIASCCVPVIFKPVIINDHFHVDGGLLNNLPVEPIREICDKVIGINSNPVAPDNSRMNMRSLLERTFLLTINANVAQRKQLCDVYLEPDCLKGVKVFDLRKINSIFENTLTWAVDKIPEIKAKLF